MPNLREELTGYNMFIYNVIYWDGKSCKVLVGCYWKLLIKMHKITLHISIKGYSNDTKSDMLNKI